MNEWMRQQESVDEAQINAKAYEIINQKSKEYGISQIPQRLGEQVIAPEAPAEEEAQLEPEVNKTEQDSYGATPEGFVGFPTKHPLVDNGNGSSNVILSGGEVDGREYVFPTMIDGKKYSAEEALNIAKENGLENYPSFGTWQEGEAWAKKYHGNINEDGTVREIDIQEVFDAVLAEMPDASEDEQRAEINKRLGR
jgi:hypothetical protein